MLVNILVVFFIILLFYQTYIHVFIRGFKEGLDNPEYKPYDTNDPNNALILAQQNAGNIEFLKQKIAVLENMQKEVNDLSLNLITVNEQIQGLIEQQQQAATQLVGTTPLTVTGTSSS